MSNTLYPNFSFQIVTQDATSHARLGLLTTPHGVVETPAFIFCATKGAMKGALMRDVKEAGTQIILSNTYHMMLQPGADTVRALGGLHAFLGWDGPMLTDSGGFQIFSLGHGSVAAEIKGNRGGGPANRPTNLLRISEEGALFRSYLNGKRHLLTPELSMHIQHDLGPDLVVVLDECTPFHVDKGYTERSLGLSHRWAKRSLQAFQRLNDGRQALYGISQGGVYPDLRQHSADFLNDHPFFGFAVGGSLGASQSQMYDVVAKAMTHLRRDRPVHLLGIGGIRDIFAGIEQGIDTFDCVHPTRLARHGGALVMPQEAPSQKEHINLKNAIYRYDQGPLSKDCLCHTCTHHTRAYIHHMLKAQEIVALQLLSIHNIAFMNALLADIRRSIRSGTLSSVKKKWSPPTMHKSSTI